MIHDSSVVVVFTFVIEKIHTKNISNDVRNRSPKRLYFPRRMIRKKGIKSDSPTLPVNYPSPSTSLPTSNAFYLKQKNIKK